jgi:5-methylcytosine-specific restriction endonuclease McrA
MSANWKRDGFPRPVLSRQERGYDADHERLRKWCLRACPYCVDCRSTVRLQMDHIIPFRGKEDPLRLDPRNVITRCRKCHVRKTARDIARRRRQRRNR